MERLIEDLLDFVSIEAGHLAINPRQEDSRLILDEAVASFEPAAREKGLQLRAEAEPHLPAIFCDRERVLQVISNLVGNAINVSAEGGAITLRAKAREHEVAFAVIDMGPGISEKSLPRIFDRHWRGNKPKYKGTGLGLAIAKGIVKAHGGRIWAESTLGQGTTFFFTVPEHSPGVHDLPAG